MLLSPFGTQLYDRGFTSLSYRYGFNGKEKDDEVKGKGDSYDYGARVYDPRLGKFFSIDPQNMISPEDGCYNYAGNSPVLMIDKDGKFKIPIHKQMLTEALAENGIDHHWNRALAYGVGYGADIWGGFSDWHFDSQPTFKKVDDHWTQLNSQLTTTMAQIKIDNDNFRNGGWFAGFTRETKAETLGKLIHTVQDFYSHSNYVELYIEYYKSQNNGLAPTEVPIYSEGVKIPGFKNLMERTTTDANGKFQGLRTGDFNTAENEFYDVIPNGENESDDPNSHNHMNKDKADTSAGKLARDVAKKHTSLILSVFKKGVGKKEIE